MLYKSLYNRRGWKMRGWKMRRQVKAGDRWEKGGLEGRGKKRELVGEEKAGRRKRPN
jgi:hypothetical protein